MAATLSAFQNIFRCTLIPQKISKFGDSAFPDVPCKTKTNEISFYQIKTKTTETEL